MTQPLQPRRPGPPHNPGVRDLIRGKRHWSRHPTTGNPSKEFRGWHERGYLPHRDEPGLTQFVTFRLVDTFPKSLRSEWTHLWSIEDDRERRTEIERYLDRGRGECHLRRPEIAKLVEENFLRFSSCESGSQNPGLRYTLHAWCIMPNHVHVLFKVEGASMAEIVGGWKTHTAKLANRIVGRTGPFWDEDYFDTFMRNDEHAKATVRYIENNPVKALLVRDAKQWQWSSARYRDPFGKMTLPS
jgi:REP element-mobilizing transposase RayT